MIGQQNIASLTPYLLFAGGFVLALEAPPNGRSRECHIFPRLTTWKLLVLDFSPVLRSKFSHTCPTAWISLCPRKGSTTPRAFSTSALVSIYDSCSFVHLAPHWNLRRSIRTSSFHFISEDTQCKQKHLFCFVVKESVSACFILSKSDDDKLKPMR
jgi:hypothetical protein